MRLKTVAAAGLAVATIVGLAACGGSNSSSDGENGKVQMTFWHNSTTGDGKAYFENLAKTFETEHPNVTIKIVPVQNEDYDGKIQTALQDPSSAPTIFYSRGGQKLKDMANAGQVKDITADVSSTVTTKMKAALNGHTIDGKIYGVPITAQPGGFWYSKDLFEKAGIASTPTTMDELKQDVQKLKDAGIAPVALGGKDAWPVAHWWYFLGLRECSTSVFDTAMSNKDFSDSCWVQAGKELQDFNTLKPFNEGFLTTSAQQGASSSAGLLANHQVAMELMGAWEPGILKDLSPDGKEMSDLGFFPFPAVTGGKGDTTEMMGGADGFACYVNAPKECAQFLNFMAEKSNQEGYAKAFATIPANVDAQSAVSGQALQDVVKAYSKASAMHLWIDTSTGQNIGNALNEGVVKLLTGASTPSDVVKAVEEAASKG